MQEHNNFFKKRWPEIVMALFFLPLTVILNTQFMDGSNINSTIAGHDEYIAVKEVYSILHPVSLKHLFMALISGNILFYGRIMFYLDALIAYVPFKIWGITGMVMAVRMTHAVLILISVCVLAGTFLKDNTKKMVFYVATLGTYYSMYFMMMPKPEPWQLLFLALFLKYFKQSGWQFGKHFILLGIAYGLKFNVLLLLPLLFVIPAVKYGLSPSIKKAFISLGYLILGLFIAIPCLALSPLKPIFLKTYLHETFGGTSKVYDDSSIGITDWMSEYGGAYMGVTYLAYPFILFVIVVLVMAIRNEYKTRNFNVSVLLLSGLILFAAIILLTKRTWPHYLWTSHILFVLGLLAYSENQDKGKPIAWPYYTQVAFALICFFFFVSRELPLYVGFSNKADVVECRRQSLKAFEYLKSKSPEKGHLKIATDGSILYPFEEFVKVDIYHPFSSEPPVANDNTYFWYMDFPERIWTDGNDYILFYKRHPERLLKSNKVTNQGKADELYRLFTEHTQNDYTADTTFGDIKIYRKK